MKYNNPVIKGFYPDPSVCKVDDTYYLVTSSFQFFPGVPLFESKDLINWKQIGHVLTRKSQVMLDKVNSSGGVFAPTIRHNNGRFYMTTTNDTTHQNFYVWTDDIYGEWSDPIYIDQGGIDPDLYFEDGKAYFMSNGSDDDGTGVILQCEIDIETGRKLSPSLPIWKGTGGRFLESPHMYKINDWYYLLAAEGGTEFGHMETYARSSSLHGPFEPYAHNPVLTNRNLGGYEVQAVGHGDLIQNQEGNWWLFHLGFRQIGKWIPYHHLGREVFLTPVTFGEDGWFTAGHNGTTLTSFETNRIPEHVVQNEKKEYTFENTEWSLDWSYLRHPHFENYELGTDKMTLKGTEVTLDQAESPTFIGIRQRDFNATISCEVAVTNGEAGITLYMDENHRYDLAIRQCEQGYEVIERLNIGDIKAIQTTIPLPDSNHATLIVEAVHERYSFFLQQGDQQIPLGTAQTKYLSSEVAGGFTGVVIGLYACGKDASAEFTKFRCKYE
ncbi:glycoside hydrolase family 43 protein [Paenibacillus urinalis]|uniref:Glycoside hydrolase family 43 protein n=1 Tax=Paenibacillus urinalis TaxID=521520 RepID=A0AAX3N867_9BACL|nr:MULTISPECIES: glycoside hydrolase family 43 protein [Paenibacillus]WDH84922.1 glycoside hydrolase family 43 protein [Paenibacillus urinalis]WDH96384.1 glycoside hydrolase family 43 protein [Paenibacillus urinalis]WDI04606.1 glycoside hydrolase family 43 protein [Paenibacillus urinalis]GAK40511.1 xylan 1,4-beta-xylosidase [Paenibacillus sp. TCA20]